MSLPVAILAGGLASRLGPLTAHLPKSLVEVAGEPFIAHQLRLLRRAGITRVVLCTGHLGEQIEAAVGNGGAAGLSIEYSRDGGSPLGTAGALRVALPLLGETFLVLYGDSYLACDYAAVEAAFLSSRAPGLLVVYRNEGRYDRSNVVFAEGRVIRYGKDDPTPEMTYIDYGLAGLTARALERVPVGGRSDLADVYRSMAEAGELAGMEVGDRFYEIGSPAGLEATRRHLAGAGRGS